MNHFIKLAVVTSAIIALSACSSFGGGPSASARDALLAKQGQTSSHGLGKQAAAFGSDNPYNDSDAEPNTVYFAFNQYNIETDYNNIISANGKYLVDHPAAKVRVEGNTDTIGSREYNVALGEHRADSVAKALEAQGVKVSQLDVISYGEEHPAVLGQTLHANAMNRRVNLVYVNQG